MKRREFIAAATVLSLDGSGSRSANGATAATQKPVKPATRAEATAIIADARKIVTPNGVERLESVRIGGIDQWVSVRGTDRGNPVLLHIHGGPGYISIPMSWWFSRGWEEYFTVVQWDQRAAGKTQLLNDPASIAPTLTNGSLGAQGPRQRQNIRERPLLGQLSRSRTGPATSRLAACLYRSGPDHQHAGERTPRLALRHGRGARGK